MPRRNPLRSAKNKPSTSKKAVSNAINDDLSADELHETAKELLDNKITYSIVPPAKRGRGRPKKTVVVAKEDSSDFPEDSEDDRAPRRKRRRAQVVEEEDEFEEEEEEEEIEEEDDEYDEEVDEPAAKAKRRGRKRGPLRLNLHEKVQRLKTDPRFHRIKPEVLGQVVEQFEKDPVTPSVIITASNTKPVQRRTRIRWTKEEENQLRLGVSKHGQHWSTILNDPQLQFQDRTQVDLKDKWRNMVNYRIYSELPIRRYVLVNENHEPILTASGSYHIFNNRWPVDAATKAATKDFIYPPGKEEVRVYLRDVPGEGQEGAPVVHVFDVSRQRELIDGDIKKFEGSGNRYAWVGKVKKLGTERLITRQAVVGNVPAERM